MPCLSSNSLVTWHEFPPRRDVASGALSRKLGDQVDAAEQHRFLLLRGHGDRVLVGVAVHAHLVALLDNHATFIGEGFDGMARDEPTGLDVQEFEQFQQPGRADLSSEQTTGDVVGRIFAAIRPQPPTDGVQINAESAEDLLVCHLFISSPSVAHESHLAMLAKLGRTMVPQIVTSLPCDWHEKGDLGGRQWSPLSHASLGEGFCRSHRLHAYVLVSGDATLLR